MRVCTRVCVHACGCVCAAYVPIHVYIYACMYVHGRVYIQYELPNSHMHPHAPTHIHPHAPTHINPHMPTHPHTQKTNIHTCTYIPDMSYPWQQHYVFVFCHYSVLRIALVLYAQSGYGWPSSHEAGCAWGGSG